MSRRAGVVVLCFFALVPLLLAGCNSGSKPIAVNLSASTTQAVMAGQTVTISAAVSHDSKKAGVTWSLTGPGALSGQTSTTVTYTAPSPVTATATATVTATSVTDSSKTSTVTINLQAVSITLTPSSAQSVDQGQTLPVSATVSGDPASKGVTWGLSGAGTLSGQTATGVSYNAPASVTAASSATITATSAFDSTKTQTVTMNLVTPPTVSTTSLVNGQAGAAYSATLAATNGIAPYTWSTIAGSLPTGLAISGSSIAGTPTASGTANFTVQATDAGGLTATKALSITVAAGVVSLSPGSGTLTAATVGQSYSVTITASGGVAPYAGWTFSPGTASWLKASAPSGSNNQTVTLSGIPGAGDVGTVTNITMAMQDSESPAVPGSATYSLTVNAGASACNTLGSESMLSGQYAFVLTGFDNGSPAEPALVGGVLSFDGTGLITTGILDMNLSSGVQTDLSLTGNYGVGSDQRGCMVITSSAGTQNYRFSLGNLTGGVAATGHVLGFDTTGPFVVGTMRQQTSAAFGTGSGQITGNYAFGVSSAQNSGAGGGKFGAVGVLKFSAGNITGGEIDFNVNGVLDGSSSNTTWPSSAVAINSGSTYTVNSSSGRGTFSFTPSGGNAVNGVLYVVSASELLALSSDTQTGASNIWAGEIMQQSGSISGTPFAGTYVGYDAGLGTSSGRSDMLLLGPFTSGNGSFPFTQLRDDSGTFTVETVSAANATYSADSTGRTTVTAAGSNHLPVLYLTGAAAAFYLNSNPGVDFGYVQSQSSTSTPSGTFAFGNISPQIAGSGETTGLAAFATPNINLTQDQNSSGTLTVDSTQSMNYSTDSSGLGYIPSGCSITATPTTCQTLFYIVSPTKAVIMNTTAGTAKLTIADK